MTDLRDYQQLYARGPAEVKGWAAGGGPITRCSTRSGMSSQQSCSAKALVAVGIPVPPVEYGGVTYQIGQAVNALLYPDWAWARSCPARRR